MTEWAEIVEGVTAAVGSDPERGRRLLVACWEGSSDGDHAQRCVLAHYLADLEPELDDEVSWDERALCAYAHVGDGDLAGIGIPSARGLAPSLHLNLGDGYLRQGRLDDARAQLDAGATVVGALGDDGYAAMIRSGLDRLAQRLAVAQAAVHP